MLNFIKLLAALIFLLLGAGFAATNNNMTALDLYFIQPTLPLSLILLFTLGIGILLGATVSLLLFFRLKKENANLKKQKQLIQQEVNNLRAMPLSD